MPIVRNAGFTMYMFQHHTLINENEEEVARLVGPTDCNGIFPSHEDWQKLVNQVGLFYDSLTPAELYMVNQHTLSQQESRQQQRPTNRPKPPRPGYVYLLKGGGYYKIGLSTCVYKLPFEIEIISFIATEDMHKLEAALHELYARKRARGEWFQLDDKDVAIFKEFAND